ncbi:MAG TPA: hypothetical protein VNI83_11645, partial [Vicinamibacterales bacterium]|nr:hypothetical protein [Vicinamibacterales bacterium]
CAPVLVAQREAGRPARTESPAALAVELGNLQLRNIGPAIMGGRIDDFAVDETNPSTFYVASASGGLFKTTNNGVTFEPIFDDQETSSIGDIALAPSNPNIVYVGTGEPNNRQSSSWGHGMYRSLDGGRTWQHLGLADTLHIGRVVVHPTNPDIVYVAALGHLWGPNKERGLFKTTDGGKTWTNTKFIDEDTGFVDVAMDPTNPNVLYAASYQRRRTAFGFNGGGPGSALWKTVDGGATWTKLTKGLPASGDIGRIGVTVYRRDPRLVYALIEHQAEGGLYRSWDAGESWTKVSDTNPRPSYYSQIHVDPNNDQRIWVLGAPMYYSEDGGKTFRTDLVQRIHGDYHAMWINPRDSNHMLVGSDGGIHVSYDRGRTWDFVNTIPLAQFYEIDLDMQQPYRVCGGLQDNGSWCGPSRTLYQQGISNEDWFRVGGGDGFYNKIDPTDPNIIYTESQDGNVQRFDLRTTERRVIRPEPPQGEKYRFNWNSPILISPHDPKTIYYGGNRLFGSKDRGDTWTLVTPDLTTNPDRDSLKIFGKVSKEFLSRNDGVVHYGTITTIAESPLKPGILWVGTDDGNVQVSRDGGRTWTNVAPRVPRVPKGTYVSRIEASRTGEGTAYVAFDGHRSDDYNPYLFRTDDFGQTWRDITGNLPKGGTISVVREHPRTHALLFVGTERALWVSFTGGGEWHRLKKLPTVPVDDIQIHPRDNDLVIGTHGRGVYVLDDITALERLARPGLTTTTAGDGGGGEAAPAQAGGEATALQLFEVRPAIAYRIYNHKGNTGHKFFLGPNPPDGALITYWLGAPPKEPVRITISDEAGTVVRELTGTAERGLNRVSWDLRHEPPIRPEPGAGGGGGFFGPPRGPLVAPGRYTVVVKAGGQSASQPVVVRDDPRIQISDADRRAWSEAQHAAARLWARADEANRRVTTLTRQIRELREALRQRSPAPPAAVSQAIDALAGKLEPLARRLARQEPMGFAGAPLADEPEPLVAEARGLYMAIGSITAPPTEQQRRLLDELGRQVEEVASAVAAIVEKDVTALNRLLLDHGIGPLDPARRSRGREAEDGRPRGADRR